MLALSPALSCTLFLAYSPVFQKPAWTILFQVHGIIFNKCSHTFNTAQLQPKLPSQCQSKKELFAGDHKLNTLHIYPGPVQFKNQIQLFGKLIICMESNYGNPWIEKNDRARVILRNTDYPKSI